jgi:AraC-like DNA-binding protein
MSIGLSLEGDFAYRWGGMRKERTCRAGTLQLWNGSGPGYCRFDADNRTRMLGIALSPLYLKHLLEMCGGLEELMSPFTGEDPFSLLPQDLPFGAQVQGIVRSLQDSHLMGTASRIYRDAKLLELFALLLDERTGSCGAHVHNLRSYDEERLREARAILRRRVLDPPSIPELSRLVGINECKLKKGFRTLFGNSVYGLLFEHRMELARTYLLDTEKSVQEIAGLCGYEHVSHFSTAFRRANGKSPVAFRTCG